MSAGNYILGGAILVGVGMFGGVSLKGCFDKPVTIYERQIEGDSKEYLVLELQGVPSRLLRERHEHLRRERRGYRDQGRTSFDCRSWQSRPELYY